MKDNISDFPGYYVTVDGKVYSRKNNRHGYLKDYHLLKLNIPNMTEGHTLL